MDTQRFAGIPASKERARRLMREHGSQAPRPLGNCRGPYVHGDSIIPDVPNQMWGTDATQVRTRREGVATVFVAVDHFIGGVVGIHAVRPGAWFEAPEPIHQGIRGHYGPLGKDIAEGLVLRRNHGPQHMNHTFQQEITFLGAEACPSFIQAPEGNGVAERFIRTPKEQLLWVRTLDTVEVLRLTLLELKASFNRHGPLQWHGYKTPVKVRAQYEPANEAASVLGETVSRVSGVLQSG